MLKGLIVIEQSINQQTEIPQRMVTGRTVLIAKSKNTKEPSQYRPIACLNTMYKTLTAEGQVSSMYIFTGVAVFLFSCRWGHLDVARYIVQQEPTLTEMKDDQGDTPLHVACL